MTFSPGFKHIWTNFYQLMKIPRETFVGVGEEDSPRGEVRAFRGPVHASHCEGLLSKISHIPNR